MYYLIIFFVLLIAELLYFRIANYFNIIDKPNERSSHTRITLRGGGIIFYIGILLFFFLSKFEYPYLFAGLTFISFISFYDDIRQLSPKVRLVIHFLAIALMFYQLDLFHLPWWYSIIALIISVGILNAYNFMDGINGITGGYSIITILTLAYINTYQTPFVDARLIWVVFIALIVFNIFNFRKKAKCFAGDVGSITIAFILLFLLGKLILTTGDLGYIIFFAIYGVDTILTIIHRLILKENISLPHRKHAYQLLANELKFPHLVVSLVYMLLQAMINLGYIFLDNENKLIYFIFLVLILSILYYGFIKKYFHLHSIK